MDILVLNSKFDILDTIDEYESCIWNIKYIEAGDCELYLEANDKNTRLLAPNNCLVRDKDMTANGMKNVMIIETVNIKTDVVNGDHLLVKGHDLKSLAGRRIIWQQTNLDGLLEVEVRRLLNENLINPSNPARRIPGIILAELKGYKDVIRQQVTGTNLLDYMVDLFKSFGIGWDIYVNSDGKMVVYMYKGIDRSIEQDTYPHVEFSPENENLLNSDYALSYEKYKNVALVAGEGEGKNRKCASVGTAAGLNRYELYVDQRDASTNNGEISESEYMEILKESGVEKLATYTPDERLDGEIEPYGMYVYGRDYTLGDYVSVIGPYGATTKSQVLSVIESYSDEGASVIPTFEARAL